MTRIAILDDYQRVALTMADWSALPPDCELVVFDRNLATRGRGGARACRLRRRLPPARAHADAAHADRAPAGLEAHRRDRRAQPHPRPCGREGARHHGLAHPRRRFAIRDAGARLGADPVADAAHPAGAPAHARGRLAGDRRHGAARPDALDPRARPARVAHGVDRARLRHGGPGLEPESHRRARRGRRRDARRQGRAVRARRRAHHPSRAGRALARPRRGGRASAA